MRIGDRRVHIFDASDRQELQALLLDQRLEKRVRDDCRAMPAGPERESECDDRMHIARTAECGQQHMQRPQASGRRRHHRQ